MTVFELKDALMTLINQGHGDAPVHGSSPYSTDFGTPVPSHLEFKPMCKCSGPDGRCKHGEWVALEFYSDGPDENYEPVIPLGVLTRGIH